MAVRVFLDPLVNLISVASFVWVVARYFVMTGKKAIDAHGHVFYYVDSLWVGLLSILIVLLNLMANTVKIFDYCFLWRYALRSYVVIQTMLICCELTITGTVYANADTNAELSFHADICYIATLIAFMETTAYALHRSIRTQDYDAVKKSS